MELSAASLDWDVLEERGLDRGIRKEGGGGTLGAWRRVARERVVALWAQAESVR